jgi:glycosyltransferase involved in cell wall biosynthesis
MDIAIFSMGPVFPDAVHGGSQKTLRELAVALSDHGHRCRILCTRRSDNKDAFALADHTTVHPTLEFKESYPEPYYAAPFRLRNVITDIQAVLDCSDVFYIHDAELVYHFLYDRIPTAIAVQDFVYPDTLAGALGFRRDRLIVTSEYVRDCVVSTFESFSTIEEADLRVVNNGFDADEYRRCDATAMRRSLTLEPEDIAILYPHRPDPRKGLFEAIETIALLRLHIPPDAYRRLRLLVPRWVDSNLGGDEGHIYRRIYAEARARAADLGMPNLLIVHDWVPLHLMPAYYSSGIATLCIGNFIEAFGNVSLESELCGTPAIVSRVGAQRSILPDHLVRKVDYGDAESAAELLARIIVDGVVESDTRAFISTNYPKQKTTSGYVDAICSTRPQKALGSRIPAPPEAGDRFDVPPWCALLERGYYNDYDYGYCNDDRLLGLLRAGAFPSNRGSLMAQGVTAASLEGWERAGLLRRRSARVTKQ